MFQITKLFYFEAAHQLPLVPEGHPCGRMHGHSYKVEVICEAEELRNGWVIDFADISKAINPIIEKCDHQVLNDFIDNPTAERIAKWIYDEMIMILPLKSVVVWETRKCCGGYYR